MPNNKHLEASPEYALSIERVAEGAACWIRDLSLTFKKGSWTAILGRSGIGKSTILHIIAGLLPRSSSPIEVRASAFFGSEKAAQQQIAWMSQQYSLLPWASTLENILIGARLRGKITLTEQSRAIALLKLLGLTEKIHAQVSTLSGGMQQRVSLARVLFEDRPIVCLDEPFSALDAATKVELYPLVRSHLQGRTVIQVTHDPREALTLADQIYVLKGDPASVGWQWSLEKTGFSRDSPGFSQAESGWGREMLEIMR